MGVKALYSISQIMYLDIIDNILLILGMIFVVLSILYSKYKLRELFLIVIITAIMLYSSFRCHDYSLLLTYFSILMVKNIGLNKFFRLCFQLDLWFLVIHIGYSVIVKFFTINSISLSNGRFSFFTSHPNIFSMVFLGCALCWIWLNFEIITFNQLLFWTIAMLFVFMFTKTDVLIALMLLLDVSLIYRNKTQFRAAIFKMSAQWGLVIILTFLLVARIIFSIADNQNLYLLVFILNKLDLILSKRLSMIAFAMHEYNLTFFGQEFSASTEYSIQFQVLGYTLDNCFINLLLHYGAIYLFIIFISFWLLARKNEYKINLFITIFLLYGMVETQIVFVYYCPVLILFSILLSNKETVSLSALNS